MGFYAIHLLRGSDLLQTSNLSPTNIVYAMNNEVVNSNLYSRVYTSEYIHY